MKKLTHEERQAHGRPQKADVPLPAFPAGPTRAIVTVPIRKGAEVQTPGQPRSYLTASERLSEAAGLAKAIGLEVRFAGTVPLTQPRPATLFGSGKVEEIGAIVTAEEAEVVIVDHALSPIQQRNLEKAWNAKVLDRTGLILEIFGERAQSKAGRLQVDLARLTYQKAGWCAPGHTWSGSAAVSASWAALAKRRSKPTGAPSPTGSTPSRASLAWSSARAACTGSGGSRRSSRWSRWWAIRTPESPRFSTP